MMPTSPAIKCKRITPLRDKNGGFTLMEVVLALTVVAMLASLGLPFVRPQSGVTALKTKATELSLLLRSERNDALWSGEVRAVAFDPAGRVVRALVSGRTIEMPPSINMELQKIGGRTITFYPDGSATAARLAIILEKSSVSIDINGATAAISISEAAP